MSWQHTQIVCAKTGILACSCLGHLAANGANASMKDAELNMLVLKQVVPWGRSFGEYRRMFALTEDDLRKQILGCGDGPASFNAEATQRGFRVISCDPLYQFDTDRIRERIAATYDDVLEQTRKNLDSFVWREIRDVEELGRVRMAAMETLRIRH